MARPDTRNYGKRTRRFAFGGLVPDDELQHHEQSETVEMPGGEWANVYGKKTGKGGQQLPDTPVYPTLDEAVEAAKSRSEEYGKEHPEHEDEE